MFELPIALAALAIVGSAGVSAAAPPPASAFGRLPAIEDVAISPDGQKIVFLGGSAEHRIISIAPIDGAKAVNVDIGKAEVRTVRWAGNDYVLVRASLLQQFRDNAVGGKYVYHLDRDFVLNTQGQITGSLLEHQAASSLAIHLPIIHVLQAPGPFAIVQGLTETSAVHIADDTRLAKADGPVVKPALWRVNVATLAAQMTERGTEATDRWDVDSQGRARVRIEDDAHGYRILVRPDPAGLWKQVDEPVVADKSPVYLGYSDSEQAIYLEEPLAGDQARIVRYALADGVHTEINSVPRGGVELSIDPYTRATVALCGAWEKPDCLWLDAQLGALYAKLAHAFPDAAITLHDWSQDRSRLVVSVDAPDAPPVWYLLDAAKGQLSPIGESYPELAGVKLGKMDWFTYKARDGLEIPAYLTLPPGAAPGARLPLVVLPHGGPAARDDYGFDWWAQFLASRGYAVLQPEFRGSRGFGLTFERAGRREWGGKMQTDLLDGVAVLVAKGTVDPSRVCIVGASYGGYAALAGVAFHPETYRCAISVNGVSDLASFVGEEARNYGVDSDSVRYWRTLIGTDASDAALISAFSPARHADQVKAPLLLITSANDTTVAPEQSTIMAYALTQAGRAAEQVTLQGDDHYLSSSATRIQMLQAVDAFLAKNLPVGR